MKIYRWQAELSTPRPLALTIGNFDGVHLGHQAVLKRLLAEAQVRDLAPALMSFFPHPKTLISGQAPSMLSSLRDRAYWLEYFGLPHWILLSFTRALMQVDAQVFVREYLLNKLAMRYLLVGDDFRFGYRGQGDFALLAAMAQDYGFEVAALESVCEDGSQQRVSSSLIRDALACHDLPLAERLLGHTLTFTARVRHGDKRGRRLQTPTVNLHVPDHWCLPDGVYVVKVLVADDWVWGVANVGKTPTFAGKSRKIEAFLFGGQYALYDEMLRVEIKHFIRVMRTFDGAEALQAQIKQDIQEAQAFIARH